MSQHWQELCHEQADIHDELKYADEAGLRCRCRCDGVATPVNFGYDFVGQASISIPIGLLLGKTLATSNTDNSTMVIDETANIEEAAMNTRLSKTSDFGSGCSADGNPIIQEGIFDALLAQLVKEGGYIANDAEKAALHKAMWDDGNHRLADTVAVAPQKLAEAAGFSIPADRKFIIVRGDGIGNEFPYSGEKLTTLLAVYKYGTFDEALSMMRGIYNVGGKGHSCGIYSFNQDHIHQLAMAASVSRMRWCASRNPRPMPALSTTACP